MTPQSLTTFVHPHKAYRLEYPSHWEQVQKDDAKSCGFGPYNRDDVGLWISVILMSVDTDRLTEELPNFMQQALEKSGAVNLRTDNTLRHHGIIADMTKEGEAGHYWIVAGGDIVLFASSQVPIAEREEWNPQFARLMASLQITREEEGLKCKVASEVLAHLRKSNPDQDFKFEGGQIRGKDRVVYLGNLIREVQASPADLEERVKRFVTALPATALAALGYETWDDAKDRILPVLKPRDYIAPDGPTQHLLTAEWLIDVVICYVIRTKKILRFVTGMDLDRWGINAEALHTIAIQNLAGLPWPERIEGARAHEGGRILVVDTGDGLASSRLLHPDLHQLFSGPLGSPFWAGIPCRDTLVLYSDRRELKRRTVRRLRRDHHDSAYPITPLPFQVTRDGIAPSVDQ